MEHVEVGIVSANSLSRRIKHSLRHSIGNIAKDWALGFAFPRAYSKAAKASPVDRRKILFVDVKSSTMPDAFSMMFPYVHDDLGFDARFVGLGQHDGVSWPAYYRCCLDLMRDMATAQCVFLCDACDVVSCVPLRSETKVVQLWHACGAFKKWGLSTADKRFGGTRKEVERHPFYGNLSLVTVSSQEVEWAYREAMGLEKTPGVVQATGVSRTDCFFDQEFLDSAREKVLSAMPAAQGKKIMLYAPTFRGHVNDAEGPDVIDFDELREAIGDEWVVFVKHHPFVKRPPAIPKSCRQFAFMVPEIPTDCLMAAADAMVTDYSSVVFEYSLFERPIAFLAPDVDDYCDWRGFYYPYDQMTPGPVMSTTAEFAGWVESLGNGFDPAEVIAFREKFMSACDGRSTKRIIDQVFG